MVDKTINKTRLKASIIERLDHADNMDLVQIYNMAYKDKVATFTDKPNEFRIRDRMKSDIRG